MTIPKKHSRSGARAQFGAVGVACLVLTACGGGQDGGTQAGTTLLATTAVATTSSTAPSAYYSAVQQMYIAYFGRPADPGGLSNFSTELSRAGAPTTIRGLTDAYAANAAIRTLIDAFGTSDESKNLYTGGTSAFVNAIYRNIFNRDADAEGLKFWSDAIDAGILTRGNAALSIMAGALDNMTAQGRLDAQSVEKKTTVAASFTTTVSAGTVDGYRGDTAAATARAMLSNVVSSTDTAAFQATVSSTVAQLSAAVVPGAPTIGDATAGDGSATVSFTAPANTGSGAITGYLLACNAGNSTVSTTGAASPLTVTGLTNGTQYSCTVAAQNQSGTGASSSAVSVTPAGSVTIPGAPTGVSATTGNATISVSFTAPANTGGATVLTYTATCTAGSASKSASGTSSPLSVTGLTNGTAYSCTVKAANSAGSGPASSAASATPSSGTSGTSSTAGVMCPYSQSVLNTTLNLTSTVSMTCSSTLRTITGNGVPDHAVGTFPNSGNPTAIGAVTVSYSNTLTPALASSASSVGHKIGYANNSVPFDPATAESYQNAGVWKIEALNQTYFKFGTDSSNAHVQPDGAYHYHGMPEGYITKLGKGTSTMTLVGFAIDGFPIYARYGYKTATDASSGVRAMNSSYRKKTTPDSGRPSTSAVPMGTFTQDYEYVAGLGDLDECNGRFGVTPEFPNGIYHYYITDGYPYIQRCVKGTPSYNGTVGR